jgi:hypothetical protein
MASVSYPKQIDCKWCERQFDKPSQSNKFNVLLCYECEQLAVTNYVRREWIAKTMARWVNKQEYLDYLSQQYKNMHVHS